MKFLTAIIMSIFLGGCSTPDYYGNKILEEISNHYAQGKAFKSEIDWKDFEMIGGYHLYLSLSGGAHSPDYNFNLIAEPEVKTQAVVKRLEILHKGGVEVVFNGSKKIGGAILLGSRNGAELRRFCDDKGVLNVKLFTSEKVIEYKLKRQSTSILNAS